MVVNQPAHVCNTECIFFVVFFCFVLFFFGGGGGELREGVEKGEKS